MTSQPYSEEIDLISGSSVLTHVSFTLLFLDAFIAYHRRGLPEIS